MIKKQTYIASVTISHVIGMVIGFLFAVASYPGMGIKDNAEPIKEEQQGTEASFLDLLDAIEWVESKGDADAVGDNGNAVGAYQIWKIYVDDVNRILGKKIFTYEDRWNKEKSRGMVATYLSHYGGTFEEMARKHNGGPQGHKKESTKKYWEKVKERLERNL